MDGRVLEAQAAREWVPSGPAFRAQEAGREMMVPDPKDLKTVLTLAYMAYDAYSLPPSPSFHQVPGWNLSTGFGWSEDGIRGYVFASFPDERGHAEQDDEVVVVSIKGTSPGAFGVGGPTSGRDKYNDNMMFSCCCGKLEGSWYTLPGCDCYEGHYTCSRKCLREVCVDWQDSYYRMAEEIVRYLQHLHPRASVWLVGHSLGGALAGITAQTLGLPAFAFEAPGDALFAARLGIVPEPGTKEFEKEMEHSRVYHWGNTGDPIFLGTCNGITSSCYISGYALESKCHLGRTCAFDLD
ncbi:Alpha/Beta hydrolase protein, partial [Hyaloraphidium curvatum]